MNNSQEILNELREVSPLLATLEKINVFQVPNGYFDNLSERLFSFSIGNTNSEFSSNKTNILQVPDGYFDTLSTNILAKIKKLYPEATDEGGELNTLFPTLYSIKYENVFKVPDGYFKHVSTDILAKIKSPDFEAADEELRNISSTLYSLRNINVFKVPNGYFESLPNDITKNLHPGTAKIVVMKSRNSWLRIAAAAVVTGVIAITSLQIFNNSSHQDIHKTVVTAATNVPDYIKESFQFKTEQQLDAGISKLSDDDIIKYLEKNGNVMDNDLLLNNSDVSGLPDQKDYLNDENTLNSYLDKIAQQGNSN